MKSLQLSRDYLSEHRRMIIGRSLATAFAGAIPVPFVDDWMVSSIRRATIRKIAEGHDIDIDEEAIIALADGPSAPPKWAELVGGGLALRLAARQWKKMMVAVLAAKRAKAAGNAFEVATLFDHYCARLHVGMGLNKASGTEIRALIDQARADTAGGLSRQLFRRGLLTAAKSTLRAPVELVDLLSGGRLQNLLRGNSEVEATTEVNEVLEDQLASADSFLARSAAAIELQLAVDQNRYLDQLIDTFDALCQSARDKASE